MKVKVTQQDLNECIANAIRRVINESKGDYKLGFEKATKRANRDIEREVKGDGFHSYNKIHEPKKYKKPKYKNWEEELDEAITMTDADDTVYDDETNDTIDGLEGFVDLTAPGDDYIETDEEDDIAPVSTPYEEDEKVPTVTIKTDIDQRAEQELINLIKNKFETANFDINDGYVAFDVPETIKDEFVGFLEANDVNIM